MKRYLYVVSLIFLIFLASCSNEEHNPAEQLDTYISLWNKNEFMKMYEMLTDEVKAEYAKEDFVDRYEKIYNDLGIENLAISSTELSDKELSKAREEGIVTVPLEVEMDSIAGPIQFTYDITLHLVEEDNEEETKDWYIEWDPGLIFPDLADGGKIKIDVESPRRGEILDRNQMPLAINDIAYEIGVVPSKFESEENEKEQIAALLNMSVNAIDEKLNAAWVEPDHFVPLKIIPKSAEEKISQLLLIPSVTSVKTTGRTYPSNKAAAHLTGYIGQITSEEMKKYPEGAYKESDMIGKRGLELFYEDKLRGEEGVKILIIKDNGDKKEETILLAEKSVKNGEHIQISIDVNIQEKIFSSYEGKSGTAAAINPKTGEILALISSPSFDPNELTYGISQSNWDALMNDKEEPFVNRFTATYAPGSVLKPVSAAIGLSNGTIKPEEGITINGLTWGKEGWGDFKVKRVSTTSKPVDLREAIIKSDNIYFAMKAVEMGSDNYIEGLKKFGFGEKLPVSFPFNASQVSNDGKLTDEVLLANTSYGQGEIEVSSLHMALAYTPFLNKGNMIKPSFLQEDKKGEIWVENVISEEDAELMQQYLRDVVTDGTAKAAKDEDFPVSGKTGTAELKVALDTKGHENGWFVGYPTEDQDMLIAMMVEKAENIGSSSFVAGKVLDILKDTK
ncbi:penicillin-binding transpeptidase domain-containing protein [Pseudogracilibacillus auburnensis]|uniref:serine-type D-Ala-D-Ala carboxypeptidase n=1 Tax=Pseudogracilibacillus auburnensis TaxID=1494959 RepID=A0A2V3WBL5_9BACI|nr:penicillin-binding transpeptidase domain-containing protein [Pseudogracilibacillus auburnensis]PXW89555.1 penicillin-binding protein [Pseudogracilibacillus auburnensis]